MWSHVYTVKEKNTKKGDYIERRQEPSDRNLFHGIVLFAFEETEDSDFMSQPHSTEAVRLSSTDVVDRWLIPSVGNGYVLRPDTSTFKDVFRNAQ